MEPTIRKALRQGRRAPAVTRSVIALRYVVGVACLIVAAVVLSYAEIERRANAHTSVESRSLNEAMGRAIDLQLDQSKTLYEISVVVLAALWGLVVAKKDEARIGLKSYPEIMMFVASTALLLASLVWRVLYLESITDAYRAAGAVAGNSSVTDVPNVFDTKYLHMYRFQLRFLVFGVLTSMLTLVFTHQLHTGPEGSS